MLLIAIVQKHTLADVQVLHRIDFIPTFFRKQNTLKIQTAIGIIALGAYIGFDAQGHSHLGQNQNSGKLTAGIFAFLALFYGGSLLL